MTEMTKTMTFGQFMTALQQQGVSDRADYVFVCPMCGTPQTANDLIRAGAGETFEDVEGALGYSCVGRWTGAGAPRDERDGKPCNWTLGGFLKFHTLEVVMPDGVTHPWFEVAPPDVARAHLLRQGGVFGDTMRGS